MNFIVFFEFSIKLCRQCYLNRLKAVITPHAPGLPMGPPHGAPPWGSPWEPFSRKKILAALPRTVFSAFTKLGAPWGLRSMIYMSYIPRNM